MHRFQVNITPPKAGTTEANLTPSAWLLSDKMVGLLNKKDLPIYQQDQSSLSLDPEPSSQDRSILTYHKRVAQILPTDRTKLAVTMPAHDLMVRIRDNLNEGDHQDELRFKVYMADLMIKFVDKLEPMLGKKSTRAEKSRNAPGHDHKSRMSRAKHVLDNVSAQLFTKRTGLPEKYRRTIAAYDEIVEARNEVVHDTEFEFARLLLRPHFRDPVIAQTFNCDHWHTLLLWVTGYSSLEDMAAVADVVKLPRYL